MKICLCPGEILSPDCENMTKTSDNQGPDYKEEKNSL